MAGGSIKPKYLMTVRDFVTFRPARARCCVCSHEWNVDLRHVDLDMGIVQLETLLICGRCKNPTANSIVRTTNNFMVVLDANEWVPVEGAPRTTNTRPTLVSARADVPSLDSAIAELEANGFTVIETARIREYDVRDLHRWAAGQRQMVTVIKPKRPKRG